MRKSQVVVLAVAGAVLIVGCTALHTVSHQSAAVMTMPDGTKMTTAQMATMAPSAAAAMSMEPGMIMATGNPSTLTNGGAPVTGRDPANQQQTTLGQAAGQGNAKILTNAQTGVVVTLSPAPHVNAVDDSNKEAAASGVPRVLVPAPSVTPGERQDGCAAGYGKIGQCIPLRAPGNVAWTCRALRKYFPAGVSAHPDQWGLDTNKDGTACDAGDAA